MIPEEFEDPKIFVDHRERASGLAKHLSESGLFEVQEVHLEIGDIALGEIIIERKTAADLFASLKDGRLFRQLLILKRSAWKKALLIEGALRPNAAMPQTVIQGTIARITVGLQIPTLFTANIYETAALIQRIAMQHYGLTQSTYRPRIPSKADVAFQQVYVLVGFRGVGVKRAKDLLAYFGSLQKVFDASIEELRAVESIGPHLAQKIYATLRSGVQASPPTLNQPDP